MTDTALRAARNIHLPAAALTLAAALALPLLFHLLPAGEGVPLGARLLPIFYAPLLAVVLAHPGVGLAVGAVAPALNHLLTGRPAAPVVGSLTLELIAFGLIVALAWHRWPATPAWLRALRAVIAPLAYLAARLAAALLLTPAFSPDAFAAGLGTALPGLVALLIVNLAAAVLAERQGGETA